MTPATVDGRYADLLQPLVRLPESAELLSSAHQAVDRLALGLLREKAAMDSECLLLAGAWRLV